LKKDSSISVGWNLPDSGFLQHTSQVAILLFVLAHSNIQVNKNAFTVHTFDDSVILAL
jgi:hypothetical protein